MSTGLVMPLRAMAATAGFSLVGLLAFVFAPAPWADKAPNAVFYAVLVLNTFHSVRFFDALPPQNRDERIIDAILALLYLALAMAIGSLLAFAAIATLLFAAATAKYVLLLPVMDRPDILRRKIVIDALGLAMCIASLIGTLYADPFWTAWATAIVFAVANVYLLAIRPMYADREPMRGLPDMRNARRATLKDR